MFSFLPDRITGCFYTVGTDGNNLHKFVMYEGVGGTFGSYIFEEVLGMGEYIAFYIGEYTVFCFFLFFCDSK